MNQDNTDEQWSEFLTMLFGYPIKAKLIMPKQDSPKKVVDKFLKKMHIPSTRRNGMSKKRKGCK